MKAANVIIFQTINRRFYIAINISFIWIKCCNEWKMFSFDRVLGFRKFFMLLKGASEILVLLVNLV